MNKRKLIFVTVLMLVLFGLAGYKLYLQKLTSNIFTGTIEVTTVDIMAKTNGYIKTLDVKEGDKLSKGQLVAALDRSDFSAQLDRDMAALAKAKAQLADLEKGARPEELQEAAANVAASYSVFEKSSADYARYQALFTEGAITKQQLDDAKSTSEVAQNNLIAAKEKQNLLLAGNRSDAIEAQKQEVSRTLAVLKMSEITAKDMMVYAPLDGLVLTKNFETGEYINAGNPIATVADMNDCWVKIYVPSNQLGLIRVGQKTTVTVDSFAADSFNGTVKEISDSAEFTPRQSITKNERANMVFAVKIRLDNSDGRLKPGMPADVIFND